jgi:CrcB protein
MSPLVWIAVALAGGGGAVFRFVFDGGVTARVKGGFPYGTLAVNLSGATFLGLVSGMTPTPELALIIGTGAAGGYTTFSTWMFESHRLGEDRLLSKSAANVGLSLTTGLVCIALGYHLGSAL